MMHFVCCQLFRRLILITIIGSLIGFAELSVAQIADTLPGKALSDLSIRNEGRKLRLKASQMPLAQVLNAIAQKIHITIHYSNLPDGLVSTACTGPSLKPLLECLLDKKADLIVRYSRRHSNGKREQIAEAWVLGAKTKAAIVKSEVLPETNAATIGSNSPKKNPQDNEINIDRIDELLAATQSSKANERAAAIAALLTNGQKGDPDVRAMSERALTDEDAEVRAQAVSILSHREGSEAAGVIQQALLDGSADVRLMAVEGIVDDVGLLQQALSDSDESIRSLAETKLELLMQDQDDTPVPNNN